MLGEVIFHGAVVWIQALAVEKWWEILVIVLFT
jgi:hypothetical protein